MAEGSIDHMSPLLAEEAHLEITNMDEIGTAACPIAHQEHRAEAVLPEEG